MRKQGAATHYSIQSCDVEVGEIVKIELGGPRAARGGGSMPPRGQQL